MLACVPPAEHGLEILLSSWTVGNATVGFSQQCSMMRSRSPKLPMVESVPRGSLAMGLDSIVNQTRMEEGEEEFSPLQENPC